MAFSQELHLQRPKVGVWLGRSVLQVSKAERRDRSPFVRSDNEAICGLDGIGPTGNDRTTESEAVNQRIRLPVYPAGVAFLPLTGINE